MKFKKKNFFYLAIFFVLVLLFYLYSFTFLEVKENNFFVISTFLFNSLLSTYFLLTLDKKDYSFNKIFWIFNLFFLTILPFVQYSYDRQPWLGMTGNFNNEIYFYTNLLILLWFISYFLGYKSKINHSKYKSKEIIQQKLNFFGLIAIYVLTVFLIFLYYFVTRNTDPETAQSIRLLMMTIIKGVTVFGLLILVNQYSLKHSKMLLISVIFVLMLYFFFGIHIGGGGRHYLAVVLFGLFLTYFKKLGNQVYFIFMLIIALIVFPYIGQLRHSKGLEDINLQANVLSISTSADFDAYTMFMNIIRYVEIYSYEYGMQLLGALFFFVPRAIWPDKPIGTGSHVSESFNFYFTNVSAPLVGEAYINFGIIGIVLFGYLLGKITKIIDRRYWDNIDINQSSYLYFTYPFLMMFFFFMLRGDLLSSYAYIFGFVVSTYAVYYLTKKFLSARNQRNH